MKRLLSATFVAWLFILCGFAHSEELRYHKFPSGTGPHDVAPAPDGTVWYTAQRAGARVLACNRIS